jgi:hypothetical protein
VSAVLQLPIDTIVVMNYGLRVYGEGTVWVAPNVTFDEVGPEVPESPLAP